MKKNVKGFLLTESLIVITFIGITLFFLFVQFNILFRNYEKSFKYNAINELYKTVEIKEFLLNTDFSPLIYQLTDDRLYIEFSDCSFLIYQDYCQSLMFDLEVENAYFVKENITSFRNYLLNRPDYGEIINYIDYINYDREYGGYRLIIEFSNNHFASINFL